MHSKCRDINMDIRLSVCNNGLAVLIIGGSRDIFLIRMLLGLLSDELGGLILLKPSGFFTYRQV